MFDETVDAVILIAKSKVGKHYSDLTIRGNKCICRFSYFAILTRVTRHSHDDYRPIRSLLENFRARIENPSDESFFIERTQINN